MSRQPDEPDPWLVLNSAGLSVLQDRRRHLESHSPVEGGSGVAPGTRCPWPPFQSPGLRPTPRPSHQPRLPEWTAFPITVQRSPSEEHTVGACQAGFRFSSTGETIRGLQRVPSRGTHRISRAPLRRVSGGRGAGRVWR